MNSRRIIFILLLIVATFISVVILSQIPNPSLLTVLTAFLPQIIISLLGFSLKPLRTWLDRFLSEPRSKQEYAICFYGYAGSGKTSLANSWFTGEPSSHGSTTDIKLYRVSRDTRKGSITLLILDYKGQKPSQMTTRIPDKFRGILGRTNAAIFIVDIVDRYDDSGNPLEKEEQQIRWLSQNTEEKIEKRISEHLQYINGSLEIVFSVITNPNLKSIRLVINKFDIFREVYKYIPNPNNLSPEEYCKKLFEKIYDEVNKACQANRIRDFQVEVISAKHDEGTRKLLNGILEEFSGSTGSTLP